MLKLIANTEINKNFSVDSDASIDIQNNNKFSETKIAQSNLIVDLEDKKKNKLANIKKQKINAIIL